jgi:uncharacterized membrane protein YfcA
VSVTTSALLVVVGVGAGLTGSMAGLASLVSYPALLAFGLTPITANVTNTVSLVFGTIGSVGASTPELRGRVSQTARLTAFGAVGGAAGGLLLLTTPAQTFAHLVPWLIAAASIAVVLPTGRLRRQPAVQDIRASAGLCAAMFAVGIYGGYFGAASGVLTLAVLSRAVISLPVAVAVKNVVTGAANAVAAVAFVFLTSVAWHVAIFLSAGMLIGSSVGPAVVRRTPPRPLRAAIALAGLSLAVYLGLSGSG